jgi:hypothetical protein
MGRLVVAERNFRRHGLLYGLPLSPASCTYPAVPGWVSDSRPVLAPSGGRPRRLRAQSSPLAEFVGLGPSISAARFGVVGRFQLWRGLKINPPTISAKMARAATGISWCQIIRASIESFLI